MSESRALLTYPIERGAEVARALLTVIDGRGVIAGSFAAWLATVVDSASVQPGDIDIFAMSAEVAPALAADLAAKVGLGFSNLGPGGKVYHIPRLQPDLDLQVIVPSPKWHAFPDDILNSFDLDVCRAAVVYRPASSHYVLEAATAPTTTTSVVVAYTVNGGGTVALGDGGLREVQTAEVFHVRGDPSLGNSAGQVLRVDDPLRQLRHIMKYTARGITFSDWRLLKLFRAWDDLKSRERVGKILAAYAEETITEEADLDWDADFDEDDDDDRDDWFEGE